MNIREHLLKAEAFERSAGKLDPTTDTALYVVFLLRAGTNRINAALHALKTTSDGAATPETLGDLNHTYKPKLNVPVPNELKRAFQHLAMIEDLRQDYVRGSKRFDAATLAACNAAFGAICADTGSVLAQEAP